MLGKLLRALLGVTDETTVGTCVGISVGIADGTIVEMVATDGATDEMDAGIVVEMVGYEVIGCVNGVEEGAIEFTVFADNVTIYNAFA